MNDSKILFWGVAVGLGFYIGTKLGKAGKNLNESMTDLIDKGVETAQKTAEGTVILGDLEGEIEKLKRQEQTVDEVNRRNFNEALRQAQDPSLTIEQRENALKLAKDIQAEENRERGSQSFIEQFDFFF